MIIIGHSSFPAFHFGPNIERGPPIVDFPINIFFGADSQNIKCFLILTFNFAFHNGPDSRELGTPMILTGGLKPPIYITRWIFVAFPCHSPTEAVIKENYFVGELECELAPGLYKREK
jgi:hypothetical protein